MWSEKLFQDSGVILTTQVRPENNVFLQETPCFCAVYHDSPSSHYTFHLVSMLVLLLQRKQALKSIFLSLSKSPTLLFSLTQPPAVMTHIISPSPKIPLNTTSWKTGSPNASKYPQEIREALQTKSRLYYVIAFKSNQLSVSAPVGRLGSFFSVHGHAGALLLYEYWWRCTAMGCRTLIKETSGRAGDGSARAEGQFGTGPLFPIVRLFPSAGLMKSWQCSR